MKRNHVFLVAASLALWLAAGCGPSNGEGQNDAGPQQQDAVNSHLREDAAQMDAAPWDAPPPVPKIVYAHTDTTLYKGDPTVSPLALVEIGQFDCLGSGAGQDAAMTDVAVDKAGNVFAVSNTSVYPLTITGSTVSCPTRWTLPSGAHFYGLTFAPAGVLGAEEMLVAANSAGELWAIDALGQTTQVGTFGKVPANDGHGHTYAAGNVGKDWELSGDIVFLENGGNWVGFATLRDCPTPPYSSNCNPVDTLVEIDLTKLAFDFTGSVTKAVKGQVVKSATCTDPGNPDGYGSMYGITAWQNKVFGFSRSGNLVEISNGDGSACLVQNYANDKFAGAGITTAAPVILE